MHVATLGTCVHFRVPWPNASSAACFLLQLCLMVRWLLAMTDCVLEQVLEVELFRMAPGATKRERTILEPQALAPGFEDVLLDPVVLLLFLLIMRICT